MALMMNLTYLQAMQARFMDRCYDFIAMISLLCPRCPDVAVDNSMLIFSSSGHNSFMLANPPKLDMAQKRALSKSFPMSYTECLGGGVGWGC